MKNTIRTISTILASLIILFDCYSQTIFKKDVDGKLLKNNEPFFINGIYHVSWYSSTQQKVSDVKLIGNSGFNCIHASYSDVSSTTAMLDEAQKLGIYLILEGAVYGTPKKLDASKVNSLKNHPALLGWNLGDDVHDNTTVQEMTNFYNEIKKLDSNHPTFFTVYNKSKWEDYFGIGDFIMPYSYPIGAGDPMGWVDHQMTASRIQALKTGTSIVSIPQAYSWSGDESGAPTPAQYRNMVYQNLINNVKGVLAYTFTERAQSNNYLPNWQNLWNEVKKVNNEISLLTDVLLDGKYSRLNTGYKEGSSEGIQAATWIYNNVTYIAVMNINESGTINVNIQLPETSSGSLKNVFQGRPMGMTFNATNKRLTGNVNARDVHFYSIGEITSNEESKSNSESYTIYPNPAKTELFITGNISENATYEITSIEGKNLQRGEVNTSSISIENLKSGIYFIKFKTNEGESVQRFVKE